MKKYILILSIFVFICFSFLGFNTQSAKAYDSGCIGSGLYSITTGQLCSTSQYGYSYNNYNYNNTPQYGYSNNSYDYGCTSTGPYNIVTGQLCTGSQYGNYTGSQSNGYVNSQYGNYAGSQYGSVGDFSNQQFSLGDRGAEVLALQQMLTNADFSVGRIDGIYGPKTDRAFLDYLAQYSNNYSYPNQNPYPYQNPNPNPNPYPYYNQAPTISGINGPQSLNVNQVGTWTVSATGINNGNLTYSVNWGDQPVYAYGTNSSSVYLPQQNATFTHTYTQVGTYAPVFTVTNTSGQSASTSLSVIIGGSASYLSPVIYSISPTYGLIGTQVTISGTGFGYNNSCTTYYCGNNGVTTNTINFGGNIIQNISSYNGTSLTFTVPSYTSPACRYSYPACAIPQYQITSGTYPVSVTNTNGVSNTINFTVTY